MDFDASRVGPSRYPFLLLEQGYRFLFLTRVRVGVISSTEIREKAARQEILDCRMDYAAVDGFGPFCGDRFRLGGLPIFGKTTTFQLLICCYLRVYNKFNTLAD